ncbi:MAG: PAS domain S-box protein [Bacteroidota bacterium]|nr:PAS domain S-box protein [Bacteroidota bacterium]
MKFPGQNTNNRIVWILFMIQTSLLVIVTCMNLILKNPLMLAIYWAYYLLSAANFLLYKKLRNFSLWANWLIGLSGLDFWYLFYNGGNAGSGMMWSFAFPFLTFYLKEVKVGWKYSLVFYLGMLAIFAGSLVGVCPQHQPLNFMLVFFVISLVLCVVLYHYEENKHISREALHRNDMLINYASDMLCVSGFDGYYSSVNPTFVDLLGRSERELTSNPFIEFVHPDDRLKTKNEFNYILSGKKDSVLENRFLCSDGTYRWISWRSVADQNEKRCYSVGRDITEERTLFLRLQASEGMFRTLTEQSTTGVFIYQNGRFIKCNNAFCNMFGCTEKDVYESGILQFIHPDYRAFVESRLSQRNEGQEGLSKNEIQLNPGYGQVRWVLYVTNLIKMEGGNTLIGSVFDVTDRKLLEEKLTYKSNFLELIVDVSSDFINSTPENIDGKINQLLERFGRFLHVDRCYLFKFDPEAPVITNSFEWCAEDVTSFRLFFDGYEPDMIQLLKTYLSLFELVYIKDKEEFEFPVKWMKEELDKEQIQSILIIPLVKNGITLGAFGFDGVKERKEVDSDTIKLLKVLTHILADTIEKNDLDKKLRDTTVELQQINVTKDKLFSIIAHDLRSPFNSFIGFTDLMIDPESTLTVREMRDYAKLLNQLALTSFDLLENLLDWSRLQQGILKPQPTEVSVHEFIGQTLGALEERAERKKQLIRIIAEPNMKAIFDKRMIETVIRNLFSNAIKFTPQGGIITIQARLMPTNDFRLCVSDTGIGIPEQLMPLIFNISREKGRPGLDGEKSSGIGLMLCKECVELHNGKIWVQSLEFKGSTFFVEIPQLSES